MVNAAEKPPQFPHLKDIQNAGLWKRSKKNPHQAMQYRFAARRRPVYCIGKAVNRDHFTRLLNAPSPFYTSVRSMRATWYNYRLSESQ